LSWFDPHGLTGFRAGRRTGGLGMPSLYIRVCVGWDKSHIHNDEEGSSVNVSHLNRVDEEGYGLVRYA